MLHELLAHSADLKKLVDEGYEMEVRGAYIMLHHIPYITSEKKIEYGTLITNLMLNGNKTIRPSDHTIWFTGNIPCNKDGSELSSIIWQRYGKDFGSGIVAKCGFSNKPENGYANYYEKFTRYIEIITAPAISLDSSIVVKTFRVHDNEENNIFRYKDTNSSKAGIDVINDKFREQKIAIIGLGGTGSYILDFMSKVQVSQIDLYDGDIFLQHNAFRSPGAATEQDLDECLYKVDYLKNIYFKMHLGICANHFYITEDNVHLLEKYNFVFISMDSNEEKQLIVEFLVEKGIPFIDTGIGLELADNKLCGQVRMSFVAAGEKEDAVRNVPMGKDDMENVYDSNIQIVELNALNAALAVIRYKKHVECYHDVRKNIQTIYSIIDGEIINEDNADNANVC